jgi:hypothetical protein
VAKCFFCGADTPLQLRRPGLYSSLAPDKRGRFGYCPAHVAEAEAKLAAAIGAIAPHARDPGLQSGTEGNRQIHADPPDPAQGTLI